LPTKKSLFSVCLGFIHTHTYLQFTEVLSNISTTVEATD